MMRCTVHPFSVKGSLSSWRAWIEIYGPRHASHDGPSLSSRRVWIEIFRVLALIRHLGRRSPQGECGLKFLDRLVKRSVTGSLSLRRAWIETTLTIGLYSMLCRPRLSFCVKLPSRRCVVISDAEFDRWGEAAERGDYGGSKGPVMHGPIFPVDADYPDIVSLGVSADMLALVDAKARRLGVGRDDVIRHAIARDLVDA